MHTPTVAVDLAKTVFQLAVAAAAWKVIQTPRLTRSQCERGCANRKIDWVIREAGGSAHPWARWLNRRGSEVKVLPAAYGRA